MLFIQNMRPRDGHAAIFICDNYVCRLPITDPQTAARLLDAPPAK